MGSLIMLKRLRAFFTRNPKPTPIENRMAESEEAIDIDEALKKLDIEQPKQLA